MQYDEFRAMNTEIVLAACVDDPNQIVDGFSKARSFINQRELRFSRFIEESELSKLNRAAGNWFQVSIEMFEVFRETNRLVSETDGLFNPAILPALIQAGYDRSMDEIRDKDSQQIFTQAVETQDFRLVQLDEESRSILLPQGMQVDLGGIAKGWIAEQTARELVKTSKACAVNAGGDMFLINLPCDGEDSWGIGLENPLKPEENLAILHIAPGAVATSSITKRQWQQHGTLQHHLIDPRSNKPAQTDWLSVTVWAERAVEAEVYAKALLITGSHGSGELFEKHTDKAYLAVDRKGWVSGSKNYHEVFHV